MTKTVKLGEICEKVSNCNPALDHKNSSFTYIDIASVDRFSKSIIGASEVLGSEAPSRARQIVHSGDVLISTVRPNLNAVAPVTVEFDKAIASTGFCVLRAKKDIADPTYIFHYSQSKVFVDGMVEKATGASYPAVSDTIIKNTRIPFPPLPEQRRIASLLDHADALRQKDRQLLAHYDKLAQSVFLDLFGDPVKNEKRWDLYKIGELIVKRVITEIQDGNHGELHPKVSDFITDGIPFIMANNFANSQLQLEESYKLSTTWTKKLRVGFAQSGDVLLTHKGSVGLTALVPNEVGTLILSPQVTYYRINPLKINPYFLKGYFDSNSFQQKIKKEAIQSTRAYIGITRQKELPIYLPPLPLQNHFANVIEKIERQKAMVRQQMDASEGLFGRLLQESFG